MLKDTGRHFRIYDLDSSLAPTSTAVRQNSAAPLPAIYSYVLAAFGSFQGEIDNQYDFDLDEDEREALMEWAEQLDTLVRWRLIVLQKNCFLFSYVASWRLRHTSINWT